MPAPATSEHEAERQRLLHAAGVLDTPAEDSFDALAACAAQAAACPVALIALVDGERLWLKASHGVDLAAAPRLHAPCAQVVASDAPLVVPDVRLDARFAAGAFARAPLGARFYAGFPLRVAGLALGSLAVIDRAPRAALDAAAVEALGKLAQAASELLALRLETRAVERERARLVDFARASGDWMWETDAELRYTWISATYEAVTGVPVGEWLGRRIVDAPLLDARGAALADGSTLHGLMRRGEPFARVLTEQAIGARRLCVSRSAVPVHASDGSFAGWRGTSRDVTARLALGLRARERDELLGKLASNLPGIIFQYRLHPDGRSSYPYVSPRAREIYGIEPPPPEEPRHADSPARPVHPDDRERFVASALESARTLGPWVQDFRIVRGDGDVRWLESRATPERLADGSVLWHGFTADVTERKQIEQALRRTEQKWELAAEVTGIGMAALDLKTEALELDRRACLNHGLAWPHGPMRLADWREAVDPADREQVMHALECALRERGTLETRYRVHHPDGQVRLLEIVARGLYDAAGVPTDVVGTCRDVTEQVAAEQLRRDKESAERANRAKTEFLSRVSHELRTPLNSILGFAQLMALDAQHPLAAAQRKRLDNVQQAGRHLLELINDVLELTRIEQPQPLPCVPVDAARALRACLATLQPLALTHTVTLPPLPASSDANWVLADARALEQVLMNLLSNAIKYNRRGGRVTLALDSESAAGAAPARLRIGVRDEGPGLSAEQQANLFQPFNRLGAEQRRIEGSGLGLVIARELARAMDGELRVASRPGAGSTFSIALPACAPPQLEAAPTTQADADASITGRRHLLYIEDEPLNVLLMQEVVRSRAEWTLDIAHDGAGGLALARSLKPDLVLIDMNLPDTNGMALIRALRGDARTASLRCIALSADAMREQIDAARNAGFDDYWTKPIDVVRMLGTLSALLAEREAV